MTIGITGASGFVGRHLVQFLKLDGISYIEIPRSNLEAFHSHGIEHIIHLAAQTSVEESWSGIPQILDSNVTLSAKVLDFAKEIGASVTLVSTYGYYPFPKMSPVSPYHLTKGFLEQLAQFYHENFDLRIHLVRLASVYGEDQNGGCLIPSIFRQIHDPDVKILTVNNLTPMRSYVNVKDVVEFLSKSYTEINGFHVSFVGSRHTMSVEKVLLTALDIAASNKPYTGAFDVADSKQIERAIKKNCALPNLIDWSPVFSLQEGLTLYNKSLSL